jgi:polar amino acid transport system permease protein
MFPAIGQIFTPGNMLYYFQFALISLGLAAVSLVIGFALAVLLQAMRMAKNKVLNTIATVYIEIVRGTPMLVQITYIFTVIPLLIGQLTGSVIRPNEYLIGVIAMSMNTAAYQAEYIRSGINGVDKGQWEACETLGLSKADTLRFIVLPQAIKLIVPTLVNEFVVLIKDTSLLATIGAVELFQASKNLGNSYYDYMSAYTLVIPFYLVMTLSISFASKKIEKRLSASD